MRDARLRRWGIVGRGVFLLHVQQHSGLATERSREKDRLRVQKGGGTKGGEGDSRQARDKERERFNTAKKGTRPELRANNAISPMPSRCESVDVRARRTAMHSCHPSGLLFPSLSCRRPRPREHGVPTLHRRVHTRSSRRSAPRCCSLSRLRSWHPSPRGVASLALSLLSTLRCTLLPSPTDRYTRRIYSLSLSAV